MGDQQSVSESGSSFEAADVDSFRELEEEFRDGGDWRSLRELYEEALPELEAAGVQWEELADHLQELADETDDEVEEARIETALGDLCADEIDDWKRAKEAYRRAFVANTDQTLSLEKARELYRDESNFEVVGKLYELELKVADSEEEAARILTRKAVDVGEHEGDMEAAEEAARQAVEYAADPDLPKTIASIYADRQSVEEALRAVVDRAKRAEESEDSEAAADAYLAAAKLEEVRIATDDATAADYARRAYEAAGGSQKAADLLESIGKSVPTLEGGDEEVEAPSSAETSAGEAPSDETGEDAAGADGESDASASEEESETPAETTAEEEPESTSDEVEAEENDQKEAAAGEPDERAEESSEAATSGEEEPDEPLFERVEPLDADYDEALDQWEGDETNMRALARIREELLDDEAWSEYADKLEQTLKYMRKKEGEADLLEELGHLYWQKIGDLDEAEYYYKRLKLLDDEHPAVFDFYDAYYAANDQWRRLFSQLQQQEERAEDPAERLRLVERQARIAEDEMENPEKAVDVWQGYLDDETDPVARTELERLYEQHEKWNGLADFLKDELERLEGQGDEAIPERVEILERLADLYEREIGHDSKAIESLQKLVELSPDEQAAFERLRGKLREARRWSDLVELLEERAERNLEAGREETGIDQLVEASELLDEELRRGARSVELLERAFELAPDRRTVRRRLEEAYRTNEDWESLFELKRRELELYDGADRVDHLYELLDLAEDRLEDLDRAVPVMEEIAGLEPDNIDIREELEAAYREREDWDKLRDTLLDEAEMARGEAKRLEALIDVAELQAEQFDDREATIEAWERVLDVQPGHSLAVAELTDLYRQEHRWDELEELLGGQGRWPQLYDLYHSAAEEVDESSAAELYRRMAEIAEGELGEPGRVVMSLERLIEVADAPEEVADELADWYRETGDIEGEIEMVERVLESTEADDERRALLERLAALEEDRGALMNALQRQIQVLELAPGRREALERAGELAERAGAFPTFAELLESVLEGIESAEVAVPYHRRLARTFAERLDRVDAAIEHFEAVREVEPDDVDVLDPLAELYDRRGDDEELVDTLRDLVDVRTDRGDDRLDLVEPLSRIADVQREQLGEPGEARATYEEILEIDPDHLASLRGVAELAGDDGDWTTVVETLEHEQRLLGAGDEERRLEVEYELAELYRERLGDLDEALHYYRQILERRPDHEPAIEGTQQLLVDEEHAREAAVLLEPIFRNGGRWAELAATLEARRRAATDDFEREEVLEELVPLYRDELENLEVAFDRASVHFELDPGAEHVWTTLESLAQQLDNWDELEQLFAGELPDEDEEASPVECDLLRRVAMIRRDRLDAPGRAVEAFEELDEREPRESDAADRLESLYRDLERHEDLAELLEDRADRADREEVRLDRLHEAATLRDELLGEPERAVDLYRDVLRIEPTDEDAVAALEGLYRRLERWESLEELYLDQVERRYDPADRRALQFELVDLRIDRLDDYRGAERLLEELLDEDPTDERAVEAFERLDATLRKADDDYDDLRVAVAEALEPVYRERHEDEKLVDALEVRLERTEREFERLELLDELAERYADHLDRPEEALANGREAVLLDPEPEERRERFESVGRRSGRLDEVVDVLEEAAEEADAVTELPLRRRVGELARRELDEVDRAIAAYRRILELDEGDDEALRALEELFEVEERSEELVDVLERRARFADPEQRADLWARIGELERRELERRDRAIEAFEQLLDVDPDDREALESLEELYEEGEAWLELIDVLERRAETETDIEARAETYAKMGRIHDGELDQPQEAIEAYRRVLDHAAQHEEALDALEDLYQRTDRWEDLADILRRRLGTDEAQNPDRRTQIELQLADLLREKLYEVEDAVDLYRNVLAREPGHTDVVEVFEELVEDPSYAKFVFEDLVSHYERTDQWIELVDLLDLRRQQVDRPERRAELSYRTAQIHRDALDAAEEAVEAFADAWRLQPRDDQYESQLVGLAKGREAWRPLVEAYEDVLPEIEDPNRELDLRLEAGEIWREELDDNIEAEDHFRAVLEIDDRHEEALETLEAIYFEEERWPELVDLLERRADMERGTRPDETVDRLVRVADLQDEKLDAPFDAAETLEDVLDLEPTHREALEKLTHLYREQKRWEDLVDHLERRMEAGLEGDEPVEIVHELGEVHRRRLENVQRAVDWYEHALDLDVGFEPTVGALETMFAEGEAEERVAQALERAYRHREAWGDLIDVFVERADRCEAPRERASFLERALEVAESQLDGDDRAFDIQLELVRTVPERPAVRERAAESAGRVEGWETLAAAYDELVDESLPPGSEGRDAVLAERGEVLEQRLGRDDEARDAYREALEETPTHEAAVDGLERLLLRVDDDETLRTFYRRRADVAETPDRRIDWLEKLARHEELVEFDIESAIDSYMEILDHDRTESGAYEALERLLGYEERWFDLVDLYRDELELTDDPERRTELQFRLGRLLETEIDDLDEAIRLYLEVLEREPDHRDAVRALEGLRRDLRDREGDWRDYRSQITEELEAHYDPEEDWRRYVDLLAEERRLAEDPTVEVDLLAEEADRIVEGADSDVDRVSALTKLARAHAIGGDREEDLWEEFTALAGEIDAWPRVPVLVLEPLPRTDEPERQASLLSSVGEVYRDRLDDDASAAVAFRQAWKIAERMEDLEAWVETLERLEHWEQLTGVLETVLDETVDAERRREVLEQLGRIYDQLLEQPQSAVEYYEELIADHPQEAEYFAALESAYERTGAYEELEELLADRVQWAEEPEERTRIRRRLATIRDEYLDRPERAIETYRALHDEHPEDADVVSALARLYEQTERWPELLEMLELLRGFAEDSAEVDRLDVKRAQVQLECLQNPEGALDVLDDVLERTPTYRAARQIVHRLVEPEATRRRAAELLAELYEEDGDWEALESLYEEQIELVDDPDRLGELYVELAGLHEQEGDARRAFGLLGQALDEVPAQEAMRGELVRLGRELEAGEDLLEMYDELLEDESLAPDLAAELHREASEVAVDVVGDVDRAVTHAEEAYDLDEYDVETLDLLDRLYQQTQNWDALAEVLEHRLDVAEPAELNDIRFRLGYLHEVIFEEPVEALDYYREVLRDEPGHGQVVDALERLVETADLRLEICEILEPAYRQDEEWSKLAQLLELKEEVVEIPEERAEIHREIADLQIERLDDPDAAFEHLGRALEADPLATGIQERFEELAREGERFERAVDRYETILEDLDDPMREVELAERAGEWALEALEAPERAGELFERVLDAEPQHEEALEGLESVARQLGWDDKLVDVLDQRAEMVFEPDERQEILRELADLSKDLEDFDRATEAYEEVLEIDESDTEALETLVGLYEVTEEYEYVVDTLDRLTDYKRDPDELVRLNGDIGQYCDEFLDQPDRAIEAYERVLEHQPGDTDTLRALEELYRRQERWGQLEDVLDRQLETAEEEGDTDEQSRLLVQLGNLAYDRFGEVEEAEEWFDRALEVGEAEEEVLDAFERIHRKEKDWDELRDLLEDRLEDAESKEQRIRLLVDLAELEAEQFDELEAAIAHVGEALELAPEDEELLETRVDLCERAGDWRGLLGARERQLELAEDDERVLELHRLRAERFMEQLDSPEDAIEEYRAMLEVAPLDETALSRSKELYREVGNLHGVYNMLDHEVEHVDDEERRVELLGEMAEMAADELDEPDLAVDALERAHDLRPDDLEVAEELIEAYLDAGFVDQAEPLIQELADGLAEEGEREEAARFEHLRGELAQQEGDFEAARASFERAKQLDDSHIPSLLGLGKLHFEEGEWEEAKDTFQKVLLHQMKLESDAQKVDVYYHLGEVRKQLGDDRRAKDMFNRALSIDSDHEPSRQGLSEID